MFSLIYSGWACWAFSCMDPLRMLRPAVQTHEDVPLRLSGSVAGLRLTDEHAQAGAFSASMGGMCGSWGGGAGVLQRCAVRPGVCWERSSAHRCRASAPRCPRGSHDHPDQDGPAPPGGIRGLRLAAKAVS